VAKPPIWQVFVATSSQAEDAVAALLEAQFGQTPVIQTDARTGVTRVSVYLNQRCPPAQLKELNALCAEGKLIKGKLSQKQIPSEDWAHSWKRHFHPIDIDSALLIKPPWSKRKARAGQAVVVLNPGLSFGTGQHPTTSFCLAQLVAWKKKLEAGRAHPLSCLDIGTGSGILAISAYKLGYRPVDGFDFDPQAVEIAQKNAKRNRVKVNLAQRDVTAETKGPSRKYDVVCANLMVDLLLGAKAHILDTLSTPGVLIVAGLLKTQFAQVREAYEASGLKFICSKTEKEWKSGVFLKEKA
jgi:ribosomal protein L11 methyltransferase